MNRKGISEVVTVILIILLSITAVIIVWQVVRPLIEKPASTISADCVTVSLEVTRAQVGSNNITVTRNAGSGSLQKIVVIRENSVGTSAIVNDSNDASNLKELETRQMFFSGTIASGDIITIAPVVRSASGTENVQCPESSPYKVS